MRGVDRVYERFTSLVADGRNLKIEKVLEIAEGRVWTGVEAQQNGLVDTCGGITAALAIAVEKSGLGDNFQIVEVKEELTEAFRHGFCPGACRHSGRTTLSAAGLSAIPAYRRVPSRGNFHSADLCEGQGMNPGSFHGCTARDSPIVHTDCPSGQNGGRVYGCHNR